MTVLTMRRIRDHFVVTGPDIEPLTFKTRYEARKWCRYSPSRPSGAPTAAQAGY